MQLRVTEVPAAEVLGVRRVVLRPGFPPGAERFLEDDIEGAFHLAAVDDAAGGEVVGVATFFPSQYDGVDCYQLRGMAVLPHLQGTGIGALLIDAAAARLRSLGATRLWAHARDTALGFYERTGWTVVGDGYVHGPIELPHHTVVLDLAE